MSSRYRIVVEGGGHNLYYVREYEGTYRVYCREVNLLTNDDDLIGEADSLEDALDMVKEHSGEDIEDVQEL